MRAVAALWVMFGHIRLFVLGWGRSSTLFGWPFDLLLYLHLGVVLFLVLSGFCLALPVARNGGRLTSSSRDFLLARFSRILPPYYATLLMLLLVNSFWPVASWDRNAAGLTPEISGPVMAVNLLLLQDVFPQFNSINGPFWSIATEWHLYFVFPALVWVLRRFGAGALLLCGMVTAAGLTRLGAVHPVLSPQVPMTVPWPPYFIALFVMAAVAASLAFDLVYASAPARVQRDGWLLGALLCLPLCALQWKYRIIDHLTVERFNEHRYLIDPLAGALAAAWLPGLCGLAPTHWLRRLLDSRPLVWIGGCSHSLYLTHVPILAIVYHRMERAGLVARAPRASFCLLSLAGAALCIPFAWGGAPGCSSGATRSPAWSLPN